jgi:hypothetical protein
MERNSSFLQELGSNPPGFLELVSQKKGMQKGMHNLARLSTTGTVRGGGEGGATLGGRGGGGGGGPAGGGGIAMSHPPTSLSWCGDSCKGGAGVSSETMDDKQTTIKS